MTIELSNLELVLIRHALGVYAGRTGFRRNNALKRTMRDLGEKLCIQEFTQADDTPINVKTGRAAQ